MKDDQMPKRKPTTNAVEIIHRRFFAGRPDRLAELEEARANDAVARKIRTPRTQSTSNSNRDTPRFGEPPHG